MPLYLAHTLKASIFLTDDLNARDAGKRLGFEVHGSIGIIAKAFYKGVISLQQAEQGIFDLYYKSNLFVTHGIVINAVNCLKTGKIP